MSEVLNRYETPSEAVNTMLNSEAYKRTIQNHRVLELLLHIVILCAKQGIALRGHRDDHAFSEHEEKVGENQGT